MTGKEPTLSKLQQYLAERPSDGRTFYPMHPEVLIAEAAGLIDSQAARIAELDGECAQSMREIAALRSELASQAQLLAEAKEVVRGVVVSRLKPDFDRARVFLSKLEVE